MTTLHVSDLPSLFSKEEVEEDYRYDDTVMIKKSLLGRVTHSDRDHRVYERLPSRAQHRKRSVVKIPNSLKRAETTAPANNELTGISMIDGVDREKSSSASMTSLSSAASSAKSTGNSGHAYDMSLCVDSDERGMAKGQFVSSSYDSGDDDSPLLQSHPDGEGCLCAQTSKKKSHYKATVQSRKNKPDHHSVEDVKPFRIFRRYKGMSSEVPIPMLGTPVTNQRMPETRGHRQLSIGQFFVREDKEEFVGGGTNSEDPASARELLELHARLMSQQGLFDELDEVVQNVTSDGQDEEDQVETFRAPLDIVLSTLYEDEDEADDDDIESAIILHTNSDEDEPEKAATKASKASEEPTQSTNIHYLGRESIRSRSMSMSKTSAEINKSMSRSTSILSPLGEDEKARALADTKPQTNKVENTPPNSQNEKQIISETKDSESNHLEGRQAEVDNHQDKVKYQVNESDVGGVDKGRSDSKKSDSNGQIYFMKTESDGADAKGQVVDGAPTAASDSFSVWSDISELTNEDGPLIEESLKKFNQGVINYRLQRFASPATMERSSSLQSALKQPSIRRWSVGTESREGQEKRDDDAKRARPITTRDSSREAPASTGVRRSRGVSKNAMYDYDGIDNQNESFDDDDDAAIDYDSDEDFWYDHYIDSNHKGTSKMEATKDSIRKGKSRVLAPQLTATSLEDNSVDPYSDLLCVMRLSI